MTQPPENIQNNEEEEKDSQMQEYIETLSGSTKDQQKISPPITSNPLQSRAAKKEDLVPHLEMMSRKPFQDILAVVLANEPEDESIQRLADSNPEKWANMTKTMASLAGYADKTEIQTNFYMELRNMGDAELFQLMSEMESDIKTIDLEAKIVPVASEHDFNERSSVAAPKSPEPGKENE